MYVQYYVCILCILCHRHKRIDPARRVIFLVLGKLMREVKFPVPEVNLTHRCKFSMRDVQSRALSTPHARKCHFAINCTLTIAKNIVCNLDVYVYAHARAMIARRHSCATIMAGA